MSGPLVTVVMAVYNREPWVARAIESVLAQTYRAFELVVVDDGSTDGTRGVLQRYASRATLLSCAHLGAYRARSMALRCARGELVAFIDSDDLWYPDRLSSQVPLFERPELGLAFGDAALVDHRVAPPRRLTRTFFDTTPPFRGRGGGGFTRGNFVPFSSVLVRRECFERCGEFAPVMRGADYLKWFEIAQRYEVDYVARPIFEYAIHQDSLSHPMLNVLPARIEVFGQALRTTRDPAVRVQMQQIIFNQRWHLAIARARSCSGAALRPFAGGESDLREVPLGRRVRWGLTFIRIQLASRARRALIAAGLARR